MYNGTENGCKGIRDPNPAYHTTHDTMEKLNLDTGFAIASSALAAGAGMAINSGACFNSTPQLTREPASHQIGLQWTGIPDAQAYRIYRSDKGCSQGWIKIASATATSWSDRGVSSGRIYSYRIEAVSGDHACTSLPSPCLQASIHSTNRSQLFEKE